MLMDLGQKPDFCGGSLCNHAPQVPGYVSSCSKDGRLTRPRAQPDSMKLTSVGEDIVALPDQCAVDLRSEKVNQVSCEQPSCKEGGDVADDLVASQVRPEQAAARWARVRRVTVSCNAEQRRLQSQSRCSGCSALRSLVVIFSCRSIQYWRPPEWDQPRIFLRQSRGSASGAMESLMRPCVRTNSSTASAHTMP